MRTKIVYKILSLSLLTTVVGSAAPNLVYKAFPQSSIPEFVDKCPAEKAKIDWSMVAQLEKMNQNDFNVEQYVLKKVMPCTSNNKKFLNELKKTCNEAKGSSNQVSVCKAIGINVSASDDDVAAQPVRSANLSEKDVVKLLEKAVPKSFVKCSSGSANINWTLVKQVEDNAADKDSANTRITAYFKDRIDGCINKSDKNFVQTLESTCSQGVGSPQQVKVCQKVKDVTGRKNSVASATDSHSLENSLKDLQDKLAADDQKIAHLEAQVAAAKRQSDADTQKITDLEAKVKDDQDKLASIIAQFEAELETYMKQSESMMKQYEHDMTVYVNEVIEKIRNQQSDDSLKTLDDGSSSANPVAANG
jgi:hypothetical protein